jgi:hypothetical protein
MPSELFSLFGLVSFFAQAWLVSWFIVGEKILPSELFFE